MSDDEFDVHSARLAAQALQVVLQSRQHKKIYLGQEYRIPGQLHEALKLPSIIQKLNSKSERCRYKGLEAFNALWLTLSKSTRKSTLEKIGWYDPKKLDWEDPRSNRKPDWT